MNANMGPAGSRGCSWGKGKEMTDGRDAFPAGQVNEPAPLMSTAASLNAHGKAKSVYEYKSSFLVKQNAAFRS